MNVSVPGRLWLVVLWVLGLLVACTGSDGDSGPGSSGCASGQSMCSNVCIDVQANPLSCGSCTRACSADEVCDHGSCKAAAQGCSGGTTACSGGCVDITASIAHCGSCEHACPTGQTCVASACACMPGQTACGAACVDVTTDSANCGVCGTACTGRRSCQQSSCQCAVGNTFCGANCTNLQTDAANCGVCGSACSSDKVCTAGQCVCPAGQMLCGTTCVDVQSNAVNCGACGTQCSLGQVCSAGLCGGGGGPGPDGCSGLAQNLTLNEVAVYQTVSVPVMKDGAEVAAGARNTDVVVGRDSVFRVFVSTGAGFVARPLSARVYVQNTNTVDSYFGKATLSGPSQEATLASTFQIAIPKDKITSSTRYAVEVVECGGTGTGGVQAPRFPATDGVALAARVTGALKIKLIPLLANSLTPDTSDAAVAAYRALMLAIYPITSLELSVGDQVSVTDATDWETMLDQMRSKRTADKPAADVYYFGLLKPAATLKAYCGSGCTAGIGYVVTGAGSTAQQANQRAALGLAYGDATSAETMAHEVGHNHGREHAPCVQGGTISGVDANYPYLNGVVGVYGWDSRTNILIQPTRTDIMGYCNSRWISDYTYDGILNRVAALDATSMSELLVPASQVHPWRVALLGARGPRWGIPISEPVAPAGTAELADILDASGGVLATVTVYRTLIADLAASSVMVPEPQPGWASVHIAGAAALAF
jgi:Metallo-peptidase family M12B Reprolysin-like